jgi:putative drug exporter of the RND superfamily
MFRLIANIVTRHGWLFALAWAGIAGGLYYAAPPWERVSQDDNVRFFPAGYPSVVGQDLLERGFPLDAASSLLVLVHERPDGKLTQADFAYVQRLALDLLAFSEKNDATRKPDQSPLGLTKIDTHLTPVIGDRLVGTARDGKGQAVLTMVPIKGTYLAKSTRLAVELIEKEFLAKHKPPDGLRRAITGSAVVGHDMNSASNDSIQNTTNATIALVVIILLVVYRSPLLALTPLLTIALSVKVSLWAIALMTKIPGLEFQVIDITNIFVIVVLFGAGTDYCLFLIARYREELIRGKTRDQALREAILQVGGALVASAGTVIVGLGMLWFSNFQKIQYTGPAIGLSLAVSLLASLTLAPVLLHWLRGAIFWPFRQPKHHSGADMDRETVEQMPFASFWFSVANLVVSHPALILIVCVAALTPLAIVGAKTKPNYSQLADLDRDRPSVVGANLIQKYFAVGEIGTTSILIEHPGVNFRTTVGRELMQKVTSKIAAVPNVSEVRSISLPLGKMNRPAPQTSMQRRMEQIMRAAVDSRYVSVRPAKPRWETDQFHITRMDVVFKTDPFSEQSLNAADKLMAAILALTKPGEPLEGAAKFGLTGPTAAVNDLRKVTTRDERQMYWLGTLGVYVVLVLLIRRPFICLYLIATVVLGYLASLGITELVFKWMHTGPEPWVGLDWKVGFFLFVILVAVGEDYNIFLMSRVIEEEEKHGLVEGTRLAVAHTGGIISSCGLIMAGTFGSMLTGSLTALRELGFALGLGVLLDTFLVRPILVPAFVVLVDRWNPFRRKSSRRNRSIHMGSGSNGTHLTNGETDAEPTFGERIQSFPHPHGPLPHLD